MTGLEFRIAADLTAMGAAVNLVVSGPNRIYTIRLGLLSVVLQISSYFTEATCGTSSAFETSLK